MPEIVYRPAREAEIPATVELFLTALVDIYARTGAKTPLPARPAIEAAYRHILRTGIFEVAEMDGQIVAICHAIVRDHLWFLSGFWARPDLQRRGIGGTLLRRVSSVGNAAGASVFFTWSSSDPTAMASYMKMGMLPGYQLLTFMGRPANLPGAEARFEAQPLALADAMALDGQIRETRREMDHEFWSSQPGAGGRAVIRNGQVAGYYYLTNGTVGPAGWSDPHDADALLAMACREAAMEAEQVRIMVPGINHSAIRFALKAGLQLVSFAHLLTTAPFGRLDRYLPSGPSLF